jgi:hypothetical protein
MQYFRFTAAIALLLTGLGHVEALADGGQIRSMESHGELQLTVFTSPTPLRAGPIDVSVLLQNAHTGQTIPDADVTVELTRPSKSHPPIRTHATTDDATNKLLRAALIDLPAPGQWSIRVECTTPQIPAPIVANLDVDAAPPLPPWLTVWPWFTWPAAVVALFAVHRTLVARRNNSP